LKIFGAAALGLLVLPACGEIKAKAPDAGDGDGSDDSGLQEDGGVADAACGDLCNSYCLRGTLTVTNAFDTVNQNPSTMAFEHLEQNPTTYRLVFDVTNSFTAVGNGSPRPEGQLRVLEISVRTFAFADSF